MGIRTANCPGDPNQNIFLATSMISSAMETGVAEQTGQQPSLKESVQILQTEQDKIQSATVRLNSARDVVIRVSLHVQ